MEYWRSYFCSAFFIFVRNTAMLVSHHIPPDSSYAGYTFSGLLMDEPSSLKSVTHILQWWNVAQKIQKTYKSCDTLLEFFWHQNFESAAFITSRDRYRYRLHFDKHFLILLTFLSLGCFSKHGCNFDDVCKIGYSRPS